MKSAVFFPESYSGRCWRPGMKLQDSGILLLSCVLIFHLDFLIVNAAENDTMCPCSCDYMDKIEYWKNKSNEYANKTLLEIYNELLPQLEATKKALEEDKTQLSSYQAKKTSAADSRPSAKQVGSTFGIIFISIFLGLVIAFDLSSYKRHLRTIRFCRRRLWFIQVHQYTHGMLLRQSFNFINITTVLNLTHEDTGIQ